VELRSKFATSFAGQVIAVAGAGGFLGSALVRALAREKPQLLVLLDASEHALFELERSLEDFAQCEFVLGSVCNAGLLENVFSHHRPQILFHAAAFKHVGLLEHNPFAAIENNVLGTHTLLQTARRFGIGRFVLVSTDKAVKPHSMMGVSKRIAELITLALSGTDCLASAIRLGNVIGSTGSVIPIFLEQIARGGPVCVTESEVSRYFLTGHEAVEAILAAGRAACDGKVVLPQLGEPVRVADLARFLIGGRGTKLRFTGLLPGEKLHEDLMGDTEERLGTVDGPLTVLSGYRPSIGECAKMLERLTRCVQQRDVRSLLQILREFVPDYRPSRLLQVSA
jgi:FlaA1/EpsC-like NDP-sugar epimerase